MANESNNLSQIETDIEETNKFLRQLQNINIPGYLDKNGHQYYKAPGFKPNASNLLSQTTPSSPDIPFDNTDGSGDIEYNGRTCDAICSADVNCEAYHLLNGQCSIYKAVDTDFVSAPCDNRNNSCNSLDTYVKNSNKRFNLSLIANKINMYFEELLVIANDLARIETSYNISTESGTPPVTPPVTPETINSDTNTINTFLKTNEQSTMSDESRTNVMLNYNRNLFYLIIIGVLTFSILHYFMY